MTRTETLLAAYPDARTKFPGWFESEWQCNSCCLTVKPECVTYTEHHDGACGGKCEVVGSMPDLTKPKNLHHLLALADAVFDCRELWKRGDLRGVEAWRREPYRKQEHSGGTDTENIFNALEKALGVKV